MVLQTHGVLDAVQSIVDAVKVFPIHASKLTRKTDQVFVSRMVDGEELFHVSGC